MPPILATCADDGHVMVWSIGASHGGNIPCAQAVAQIVGSNDAGSCACVCFLRPELLACAFFDGSLSIYHLQELCLAARVRVSPGDPLLALEAISLDTLAVGSAGGVLVGVELELAIGSAEQLSVTGFQRLLLQRSPIGHAVCSIRGDSETLPKRFLVCFANLELWIWENSIEPWCAPRHLRTWIWPESNPKPMHPWYHVSTHARCQELLACPPLVACFVPSQEAADLVVITATPASCFYLYSCDDGTIVNRIPFGFSLPPVTSLCALLFSGLDQLTSDAKPDNSSVIILILCKDRFLRVRLSNNFVQVCWIGEPVHLPTSSARSSRRPGSTSDACIVAHTMDSYRVLLKGETAISCWTIRG